MMKRRNPFSQYWANVWSGIATTFIGMKLTLGYIFRKKFTMCYPEERPEVPESHRGLHKLNEQGCLVCMACAKACPVDAIKIESVGRGRDAMPTRFDVEYSKCLFCALCTESCSNSSIAMTKEWDFAGPTREGTTLSLIRAKSADEIKAHEALLAQKEAEKKAKAAEAAKKAAEEKKAKEAADAKAAEQKANGELN